MGVERLQHRSASSASTDARRSSFARRATALARVWGARPSHSSYGLALRSTRSTRQRYAALVNGGVWRPATLMKMGSFKAPGPRVFSEETSNRDAADACGSSCCTAAANEGSEAIATASAARTGDGARRAAAAAIRRKGCKMSPPSRRLSRWTIRAMCGRHGSMLPRPRRYAPAIPPQAGRPRRWSPG
jgi:hypothetical protein